MYVANSRATMRFEEALRRCEEQLSALGYATDVQTDSDGKGGEIGFERDGETYYLELGDDLSVLRFSLSYELGYDDKRDRNRLYYLANDNSSEANGAVTTIDDEGDVEFRHDAFVRDDFELGDTLERILSALAWAKGRFFDQLGARL